MVYCSDGPGRVEFVALEGIIADLCLIEHGSYVLPSWKDVLTAVRRAGSKHAAYCFADDFDSRLPHWRMLAQIMQQKDACPLANLCRMYAREIESGMTTAPTRTYSDPHGSDLYDQEKRDWILMGPLSGSRTLADAMKPSLRSLAVLESHVFEVMELALVNAERTRTFDVLACAFHWCREPYAATSCSSHRLWKTNVMRAMHMATDACETKVFFELTELWPALDAQESRQWLGPAFDLLAMAGRRGDGDIIAWTMSTFRQHCPNYDTSRSYEWVQRVIDRAGLDQAEAACLRDFVQENKIEQNQLRWLTFAELKEIGIAWGSAQRIFAAFCQGNDAYLGAGLPRLF